MPIYAYKCSSCGHARDVLQKMSDPLLTVCPHCGAEAFSKQLTAAGFQLKGSGWYATDFKGGNKPAPAAGDGGEKPTSASSDAPAATPSSAESGKPDKAAPAPSASSGSSSAASASPAAAPKPATGASSSKAD